MSIKSPNEDKVSPRYQECKVPSQNDRERSQGDVDSQAPNTMRPKYPATPRVKKLTEIKYDQDQYQAL